MPAQRNKSGPNKFRLEARVCVLQTCVDLLQEGYAVHAAADCVTSSTDGNKTVGIQYMRQAGAVVTSCETVMFQLLKRADTAAFKTLSRRIK